MSSSLQTGCQTNAWPVDPNVPATLLTALKDIKDLGFSGFETSFRNLPALAREGGGSVDTYGLQFFGVHIFLNEYDEATLLPPRDLVVEVMALASRLGAQHLVVSGTPASNTHRVRAKADALRRLGDLAAKVGMRLCYHNHGPELNAQSGRPSELESLAGEIAGSPVQLVFDAGHAFRAKLAVPQLLSKLSGSIAAIHVRDSRGEEQAPLGSGDFPLADMAAALKAINWRGWIVAEEEREDGSKLGRDAVSQARSALRDAFRI